MSERLKEAVLKTVNFVRGSWVRIPSLPPYMLAAVFRCGAFFSEKGFLLVIFGRQINMMRQIRRAAGLTIGAMIYSAGLNLFLVPNNIIDGGVTGMSFASFRAGRDSLQRTHRVAEYPILYSWL